MYIGLYVK